MMANGRIFGSAREQHFGAASAIVDHRRYRADPQTHPPGMRRIACVCDPAEVDGFASDPWIRSVFHDCVYTPADYASFSLGWLSIVLFMVCTIPQIASNYRRKSVRGISRAFVVAWLLGDLFNVAGCILGHQLPTQTITGVYFCVMDAVLLGQIAFYSRRPHCRRQPSHVEPLLPESSGDDASTATPSGNTKRVQMLAAPLLLVALVGGTAGTYFVQQRQFVRQAPRQLLLLRGTGPACLYSDDLTSVEFIMGSIVSWASGLLYFLSRVPQVYHNIVTKTCTGLSVTMFAMTVTSNIAYGASILLRFPPINGFFFAVTLPFLIGSVGTLVFDVIIVYQLTKFERRPE
ncbi:PQ loop repeat [Plasmodiophora brassicae]